MTDDDSTTSVGLFNTAEAYRLSAIALERAALGSAPAKIGFAEKPVRFLYCHAIELYLKALLRQKHSAETIRNKFGHNTKRLVEEAETLGMFVTVGDRDVFAIMHDTDIVIEARYIRTGPKTSVRFDEEVRRTCKRVRDSVGDLLFKAGVPVRRR